LTSVNVPKVILPDSISCKTSLPSDDTANSFKASLDVASALALSNTSLLNLTLFN